VVRKPKASKNSYLLLPKEAITQLSKTSLLKSVFWISINWIIIVSVITSAIYLNNFIVTILSVLIIATRQYALSILLHDAAHYNISRKKLTNDLISSLFLSFPLLVSTELYRQHHLMHHRHLHSENDPDVNDQVKKMSKTELVKMLIGNISGIYLIKSLRSSSSFSMIGRLIKTKCSFLIRENLLFVFFILTASTFIIYFNIFSIVLIFWFLPMLTFFTFIYRFNAIAEHSKCNPDDELEGSRNIDVSLIERLIISPFNKNYHLTHHLFPGIPFFNLKKATQELLKNSEFKGKACINRYYFFGRKSFFKDIIDV